MKYIPIQAVASQLTDHFHIDMNLDQVIRHSGRCLKTMGMIALQKEVIKATVENFQVNLPARVKRVRAAVNLSGIQLTSQNVFIQEIYFPPQTVWVSHDEDISTVTDERAMLNAIPQIRGPWIPFVWNCPYVRFNETDLEVALVCTSMKVNKEGWPMIPEDALDACVYYCMYSHMEPLFLTGKLGLGQWQEIKSWKNQKMRRAETTQMLSELNQNEMNSIFDTLTSFDRKQFGVDA